MPVKNPQRLSLQAAFLWSRSGVITLSDYSWCYFRNPMKKGASGRALPLQAAEWRAEPSWQGSDARIFVQIQEGIGMNVSGGAVQLRLVLGEEKSLSNSKSEADTTWGEFFSLPLFDASAILMLEIHSAKKKGAVLQEARVCSVSGPPLLPATNGSHSHRSIHLFLEWHYFNTLFKVVLIIISLPICRSPMSFWIFL